MKKCKAWIAIPLYWIAFLINSMFLDSILIYFPLGDFIEGSNEYHYGPCSFSVTVSFVLLIMGIIYVVVCGKKEKSLKEGKRKKWILIGTLVFSFVMQFFFYLSHFSYFHLFGIVMW